VFPCFNVSVVHAETLRLEEEEELAAKGAAAKADDDAATSAKPIQQSSDPSESAEMHSMRQKDWVMRDGVDSSAMRDSATFKFQVETALAEQQILRYDRWPLPSKAVTTAAAASPEGAPGAEVASAEVTKAVAAAALRSKRGPLWVKSEGALHQDDPKSAHVVPPCSTCGAPRRFEFQVMPQLLHYLESDASSRSSSSNSSGGAVVASGASQDTFATSSSRSSSRSSNEQEASKSSDENGATNLPAATKEATVAETDTGAQQQAEAAARAKEAMLHLATSTLDWGTLAVFTCTASCGGDGSAPDDLKGSLGAYKKEFIWRQSPL